MTRNVAASVRARLANQATASKRPFQEVLQHYALERLLYRLAQSPHGRQFLLKGALLLKAWGAPLSRPTRDIDLLGYVPNEAPVLEGILREVCACFAAHPSAPAVPDSGGNCGRVARLRAGDTAIRRNLCADDEHRALRVAISCDMVTHMKTTIEIADVIFERAKTLAAREGTTVRALVEDGLRQVLRSRREAQRFRLRDASVDGQGLQPEFQDAGWERIRDALYEGRQ